MILSRRIAGEEIGDLLTEPPDGTKRNCPPPSTHWLSLQEPYCSRRHMPWLSVVFPGTGFPIWDSPCCQAFTGTMLFFFGLRSSLGLLADRTGRREKLHAFTFRQLQENVIHRSHSLAISSLLILAALCCFGAGVAIAQFYKDSEQHVLDYTFPCAEAPSGIREKLSAAGFSDEFDSLFEMKVGISILRRIMPPLFP